MDNIYKRNIPYFSDKYEIREILGKGAFGTVNRIVKKTTGEEFAVKIINVASQIQASISFADVLLEALICKRLRHPHIVRFYEHTSEYPINYLVFELQSGGELYDNLGMRDHYSEADASKCIQQILKALCYCHRIGIVHRDIKPSNLLLSSKTKDAVVKLADFGLAIKVEGDQKQWFGLAGTPNYISPEVIKKEPYGKPVDIWACGVILYTLIVGYPPLWHEPEKPLFEQIKAGLYDYPLPEWGTVSVGVKGLIDQMLTVDSSTRINAAEALNHPWISQRDSLALVVHRHETVERLKMFNAR